MKENIIHFTMVILIFTLFSSGAMGQDILTKEECVAIALENNFGIRLAKNSSKLALNNTSIYNTGNLPTIQLNGAYSYNLDNTNANFQDGRTTSLSWAASHGGNASLDIGYNLYDGSFRKVNKQQLMERYALSELQLEATMENVTAQTLSQYYQIVTLEENKKILEEAIGISLRRQERAQEQYNFGQGNKLAILNARVDLNNDSLSLQEIDIQIDNARRTLNNILITPQSIDYRLDNSASFITSINKEELRNSMVENNLSIKQVEKNIEIGNLSVDLANTRKLPTINASASYGYSYSNNNSASFLSSLNNHGLTGGISMTWNLFDGGGTRHSVETVKLNNIGLALERDQMMENLKFDFETTWANYENRLLVYETNIKNVEISKENFSRTEERFKIGQVNSVDFRQAQLNLLNAETALNVAKFQVKISEIELLLLSGKILE